MTLIPTIIITWNIVDINVIICAKNSVIHLWHIFMTLILTDASYKYQLILMSHTMPT